MTRLKNTRPWLCVGDEAEFIRVRLRLAETALDYIESQVDLDTVPPVIADRVRQNLRARVDLAREASAATDPLDAGYRAAPRRRARATR